MRRSLQSLRRLCMRDLYAGGAGVFDARGGDDEAAGKYYRCVNIALVNELKMLTLRMGVDIWEVIDAASTKPFGFHPFYPGPGLGGHCIPIDPFYLSWKAKEYDFNTRFIELAGEVNEAMPAHVVQYVAKGLNQHKKALNGRGF